MKVTLSAEYVGIPAGAVIDVNDATAQELVKGQKAVEFVETKSVETKVAPVIRAATEQVKYFDCASEFFRGCAKALAGMGIDPRLRAHIELTKKASLGQGEDSTAAGGGLVAHPIYGTEIFETIKTAAILHPKCKEIKITSPMVNGIRIPQINAPTLSAAAGLFGGVKVYAVSESSTATPSAAAYTQKDVSLNKLVAIIPATREILQDVAAFRTLVYDQLREALAWYIDECIVINTLGAFTQPIVGSAATNDITFVGSFPTAEEVRSFWAGIMPADRARGEWYMSNSMQTKLLTLNTTVTTSGANIPLYQPDFTKSPGGMLLGRPVNVITQAGADGTPASFGFYDLASNYAVVSREDVIEDSNVSLYYLTDQELFRILIRISGTPLRATKVTLADGTIVSGLVTRAQL